MIWLSPQPSPAEIPAMYDTYYTHDDQPDSLWGRAGALKEAATRMELAYRPGPQGLMNNAARALLRIELIRDMAAGAAGWVAGPAEGRVLDIGCGSGQLLARLASFGWQAEGAEPDSEAAALARRVYGLRIHQVGAEDLDPRLGTFDVITMIHVLEHVVDPVGVLTRVAGLLAPSGRCVIVTPNASSYGAQVFGVNWVHWDPPRHLNLFDPSSAMRAARNAGFAIMSLDTSVRMARFTWKASRDIRRHGKVAWEVPMSIRQRAAAWRFQFREAAMARDAKAGEEIVMQLRRSGTT